MTDWSAVFREWPIDWLTNWWSDRLTDWWIDRLTDWLTWSWDRLTAYLYGWVWWLSDWEWLPNDWLIDSLLITEWLIVFESLTDFADWWNIWANDFGGWRFLTEWLIAWLPDCLIEFDECLSDGLTLFPEVPNTFHPVYFSARSNQRGVNFQSIFT